MIRCEKCYEETGQEVWFFQVSGSHLRRIHGIYEFEYQRDYPDSPLIDEELRLSKNSSASLALTGRVNGPLTEETKKKISDSKTGVLLSIEHCEAISRSHIGIVFTDEHKENLSRAHYFSSRDNTGHTVSEETKQKLREAATGRLHSEETKKLISTSKKAYFATEEGKVSQTSRLQKIANSKPELAPYLSKGERYVHVLLEDTFPGQYKYAGDGSFYIGSKNPDFKHTSKMKVIEFYGSENYKGHYLGEEEERSREFAEHGYEVLFIRGREIDLREKNFEKVAKLLDRIKKFTYS